MSAGETTSVSLNLSGDFAAQAAADAAASRALIEGLDGVAGATSRLKEPSWSGADWLKTMEKGAEQAARKMDGLRQASLKAAGGGNGAIKGSYGGTMPDALKAPPSLGGFAKLVQGVERALGPGAAEGVVKGASFLSEASEKLGPVLSMLGPAAKGIAAGGAVVLGAAAALLAAGAGLVAAGVKFGIETTSKKEIQDTIFKKVGGSYEAAIDIAAKYGIDSDVAVTEVKKLLGAKFSQAKIDAIMRVSVGIGAVLGEEKAKAFIEKMTQNQNKGGKASEETIKGFAEAGVAAESVYAQLATKLGISIKAAKAKVKSGAVDMKDALDAVRDAAGKDFGGVADKLSGSIPALINKIKIAFTKLFGGFDLGPLKSMLKNVGDVLGGPVGKGMGEAFSKLGSTVIKALFGPMSGDTGKSRMESIGKTITAVINGINSAINFVLPYITKGIAIIKNLFSPPKEGSAMSGLLKGIAAAVSVVAAPAMIAGTAIYALFRAVWPLIKLPLGIAFIAASAAFRVFGAVVGFIATPILKAVSALASLLGIGASVGEAAGGIGGNMVDGILGGIEGGVDAVFAAAGNLAQGALNKIKSVLGVASPAKALIFVGDMMGDGMAKGMNDNAEPLAAGEKLAAKGVKGAAKGAGKGGGAGGEGGGEAVVINVYLTAAPGMSTADAKALGDVAGEAAYEAYQKNKRRDARENGRAA